jgi:hypothetical protein
MNIKKKMSVYKIPTDAQLKWKTRLRATSTAFSFVQKTMHQLKFCQRMFSSFVHEDIT